MSQDFNNPFASAPKTQTRLQALNNNKSVIVVTQAFGPTGADLMDYDGPVFSGEPGVKVRVKQGDIVEDVVLSPFYGDPSKKHSAAFQNGVECELFCPHTNQPLDKIPGMTSDSGGEYYAIYMTSKLKDGEFVAVNNVWGNPSSRVLSEGEWLKMILESEQQDAEN